MTINYLSPDFSDSPGSRGVSRDYKRDASVPHQVDVSIVTPYFNTDTVFVETFLSLKSQSFQNWEWVIVDDGSSDVESIQRVTEFAAEDERIQLIHQENSGPSAARNAGFRNTVGRYICLLDSDDLLEPTYLEKCVWFLESNPEYSFCNTFSIVFGDEEYLWATGFERGKAYLKANSGPPISVIRRTAYSECGGFDESIRFGHEDWDFWLAMAKVGHWGYTIPEYLQWYRKRANGRFEQIMKAVGVNDEFEKLMHRKYKGLDKVFPELSRRQATPYETIETQVLVCNPLLSNPSGRRFMFLIPWMVTGGADRVNLELLEGLTAQGHDVTVCATLATEQRWEYEFSRFTPDIFVLPNFLHASDYPRFLSYLIQSRHIDTVVITGSTIGYQLLPYLRAISPEVAFVDMCHVEELHWQNGGHPRFGVGYQDLLDLNITTTKNLSVWMQQRGADSERIRVMYTGVRAAHRIGENDTSRIRTELGIPLDMPIILFAGRICEQKRPAMLAEILKRVHAYGLAYRAIVVGDGELRPQLDKLLADYQLTHQVHVLGSVTHQRWLEILAASNILLMPSEYEGISIALLEAIATGVVPVVANVGGQSEIVSEDSGILIPRDGDELNQYVSSVCKLLSDASLLQKMSNNCRAIAASRLSWHGMIDNFLAIIDEAHNLRLTAPRSMITPQFGRELATQALEYNRLGKVSDWLWNTKSEFFTANAGSWASSVTSRAALKVAIMFSQTRLGQKLIRNRFFKALFKRVSKRLFSLNLA